MGIYVAGQSMKELALLFHSIMEKKKWFSKLSSIHKRSSQISDRSSRRRRASFFNATSKETLDKIGINSVVSEKFKEIDTEGHGYLSHSQLAQLVMFMYRAQPEEGTRVSALIEKYLEDDKVVSSRSFTIVL
jgi:hypothetical protein